MRTLEQIYSYDDIDTFVLGSSQYLGIYREYLKCKISPPDVVDNYTNELINSLREVISILKERIQAEAEDFDETPELEDWESLNLKLKLLLVKENDVDGILKLIFSDFFKLLKNRAWDLWSALSFIENNYPELTEYLGFPDNTDSNELYGAMLYFFSRKLKLEDEEVKEIFGGFDT